METIRDVQREHKRWYEHNFAGKLIKTAGHEQYWIGRVATMLAHICHAGLKEAQGIRPNPDRLAAVTSFTFQMISRATEIPSSFKLSLGAQPREASEKEAQMLCIMGALEEIGELLNAHQYADKVEMADAIGDIHIYLTNFCNLVGLDHEEVIIQTAHKVFTRDWVKYPVNGRTE